MATGVLEQFCSKIIASLLPVNALLVLLWSLMVQICQLLLIDYVINSLVDGTTSSSEKSVLNALFYLVLPTYLVIGLVADICVGRYRIIVAGLYCACVGWLTVAVSFCISQYWSAASFILLIVGFSLSMVGAAGIQSVAVPFNIDQLIGVTADELSAVIYWHVFGYPLGYSIMALLSCTIDNKLYLRAVYVCVSGVAITIVMVTYYLLRHHLDTTPLLTNPIRLIVKVLSYAKKNKYPRLRSALTYWEESAPSRLDLGKDKYGGPFTEEEVEDVKTFFRFLPLLVCLYGVISFTIVVPVFNISSSVNRGLDIFNCILDHFGLPYHAAVIVLLLYKAFFSRICYKCIPSMLTRIGMGLCLLLANALASLAIDIKEYSTTDSNCTSSVLKVHYDATTINYFLMTLSQVLGGVGMIAVLLVSVELTVAQSPGHMRGLMVGVWYGALSLFSLLNYGVFVLFAVIDSNCGLYYHVTVCVLLLMTIILYGVLAKRYKLRVRNEVINIHHVVATVYERYFDQSEQNRHLYS